MPPDSTALTTKVESGSPYQLDAAQTLRASSALLKHIKTKAQSKEASSETKNLLALDNANPGDTSSSDIESIWLILTGKKFLADKRTLKPRKISLPHSLHTSPNTSICLITPEPQRVFKEAIAHPSFSLSLSKRISRVIDIKKLEAKYHSFESKRQLRDSYDLFLADDRIITYLSKSLGTTFYKTTPKRPIPVSLEASKPKERKNAALPSTKPHKDTSSPRSIAPPSLIAKEIERTLSTAQIHLSPSVTTTIRVGLASFIPEQLAENIKAVMTGLMGKIVAWRNLKSLHVKGPNTMALPIWLAEEMWADESMVLEEKEAAEAKAKGAQKGKRKRRMIDGGQEDLEYDGSGKGKKRKGIDGIGAGEGHAQKKVKKLKDDDMSQEMKERREKLRQQKREARQKVEGAESKSALISETLDVVGPPRKSL
ncbi:hypothetical protein MMC28_008074 [Mycoblastus sanguinarius]|nr:hypothetical protein [Mycoblastus sanguinarius]